MDLLDIAARASLMFIPFLFALCFHEYAHGWVARLKGDKTAETMGRLTLNPIAHMDLIGTVILPLSAVIFQLPIFFGWAKRVPVNSSNLKNPRRDMFWIALAGPLSNVLLALLGTLVQAVIITFFDGQTYSGVLTSLIDYFILINLFLAIFNLLPLHPLDGGTVIARFLPEKWNKVIDGNEQVMGVILLLLIVTGGLAMLAVPVYYFKDVLKTLALGILA